jgi:drug/metabolite transporter (DMT)-like permease
MKKERRRMSREILNILGLSAFALTLAAGQMLFKLTAQRSPTIERFADLRHLFADPVLWLALVVYGLATLLWVYLLQRVALTYAYPFAALAFVLVPFGAAAFFDERLSSGVLAGAALIVAGICVTGLFRS